MVGSPGCCVMPPLEVELDDSVQMTVELVEVEGPGAVQAVDVVVVVVVVSVGPEPVPWVPGELPGEVVVVVTVGAADVVDVGGPDCGLLADVCDWLAVVTTRGDVE